MEERDLAEILEKSLLRSAAQLLMNQMLLVKVMIHTHVLRSVQCWPVKHWLDWSELNSQVGWTHSKLMLAATRPAKAPMLKMDAFIL